MAIPSCATFKTLNVVYTPPTIAPANGYVVKWRVVGSTTWNTVSGQYGNPIQIAGVPTCFAIEGTIQADCGDGNLGTPISFAISAESGACYYFTLLQSANYTYVPCGSTTPVTVTNLESSPLSVCAVDGTVSGGSFTRTNQCSA